MKYYLVPEVGTGRLVKVGAQGFTPEGAVVEVPSNLAHEDDEALVVETTTDEMGIERKRVAVDEAKREERWLAKEAQRAAQEAEEKVKNERKDRIKNIDWSKVKTIAELS